MKRIAFLVIFLTSMAAIAPSQSLAQDKGRETYRQLELFGTVFDRIRNDYVETTKDQDLIETAINGMLSALDPHSSYLSEKSFKDMQVRTRGEFGGLGIEVTMTDGLVKVMSPIDDTPAFRAGIKAGDMVTHLDGAPIRGLTLQQAVEKMRGKVGEDIKLTIQRGTKQPFDVTITRARIKITPIKHRLEANNIGYIRITSFNDQTTIDLKKAYKKLQKKAKKGISGLVLDLRNNPGGLLKEAISVSDAFLDRGEIVSTRGRKKTESTRSTAQKGDITNGLPIVVLVNGGSASASEIVAGALQDHRRAIILGTRSFGKGSVQTIMPLPGHGAIRLTTQRYYTPSGRSIQGKGIEPDIMITQLEVKEISDLKQRREKDLRGALSGDKVTAKDKKKAKDEKDAKADKKIKDYQLTRAMGVLRGIALYRQQKN